MCDRIRKTPACKYCYDKKYFSRCYDEIGYDDFTGEGGANRALIENVPCKKCSKENPICTPKSLCSPTKK